MPPEESKSSLSDFLYTSNVLSLGGKGVVLFYNAIQELFSALPKGSSPDFILDA